MFLEKIFAREIPKKKEIIPEHRITPRIMRRVEEEKSASSLLTATAAPVLVF